MRIKAARWRARFGGARVKRSPRGGMHTTADARPRRAQVTGNQVGRTLLGPSESEGGATTYLYHIREEALQRALIACALAVWWDKGPNLPWPAQNLSVHHHSVLHAEEALPRVCQREARARRDSVAQRRDCSVKQHSRATVRERAPGGETHASEAKPSPHCARGVPRSPGPMNLPLPDECVPGDVIPPTDYPCAGRGSSDVPFRGDSRRVRRAAAAALSVLSAMRCSQ